MQQTDWNGLSADEKDGFVSSLVEYGTDFVAPLYSVVEKIEDTLQQKNSAFRAQADARPVAWRVRANATHAWLYMESEEPFSKLGWLIEPIYTHPEASAPGLIDQAIAICQEEGDEWDSDRVQATKNYAHACRDRIRALTRASGATGGNHG